VSTTGTMGRGIDHVIHLVRNLDNAAKDYERLGFLVGGRNRHPFGTHNRIVQLDGSYVEILEVAEPGKIEGKGSPVSFAHFHRDFLQRRGEGLTGLVLSTGDAAADQRAFDDAGFGGFEMFDFGRKGRMSDGREVDLAFSLAFLREPTSDDALMFTVRHHHPENFWEAPLQQHSNGMKRVAATVFTAESPADHQYFLQSFTGMRDIRSSSLGVTADTPRGMVRIMEPEPFRREFGLEPPLSHGMRFGSVVFAGDMQRLRRLAASNDIELEECGARLAMRLHGAVLAFEAG
jgi:hypothetical protein